MELSKRQQDHPTNRIHSAHQCSDINRGRPRPQAEAPSPPLDNPSAGSSKKSAPSQPDDQDPSSPPLADHSHAPADPPTPTDATAPPRKPRTESTTEPCCRGTTPAATEVVVPEAFGVDSISRSSLVVQSAAMASEGAIRAEAGAAGGIAGAGVG